MYVADSGTGLTGGVGLPQASLTLSDGKMLTGENMCEALHASKNGPPSETFPLSLYRALRDQAGKPVTFPAQNPPVFMRPFSITYLVNCVYKDECGGNPAVEASQYSNPDTEAGETVMGWSVDMRYWSICQNESIATAKVADCLYDEQIPVNADDDYTIVSSSAENRPSNATAACGVAWLGWPKEGDGEGHTSDGMLIVRNTLPDPDFTQAVQDVATPGTEATVMGPYLPTGSYTTEAGFEDLGCPVDH